MKYRISAAIAVGLSTAMVMSPSTHAEPVTRIVSGSAGYPLFDALPRIPLVNRYFTPTSDLGLGFYPDTPYVQVRYAWWFLSPGAVGRHIGNGAARIISAVNETPGQLAVIGTSHGATNTDDAQRLMDADPNAASPDRVEFVMMNDPERGIVTVFLPAGGVRIPFLGYITPPLPSEYQSRYDTTVVAHEYDLWGDFPNRPWNLVAVANSLAASIFVHQLAYGVPDGLAPQSVEVNSLGATTTSYFVPTAHLPITEPLRIIGIPDPAVDRLDALLRPTIDAGYSRNDAPGDTRPYLDHGRFAHAAEPPVVAAAVAASPVAASPAAAYPGLTPEPAPDTAAPVSMPEPAPDTSASAVAALDTPVSDPEPVTASKTTPVSDTVAEADNHPRHQAANPATGDSERGSRHGSRGSR